MARSGAGPAGWLRRSAIGRAVAARLGAAYIRLVFHTTRWQVEGRGELTAAAEAGDGVVAAIWHGRVFLSPAWALPGRTCVAMISNNRDGDLIAAIVARFGIEAVRGSTYDRVKRREKGGAEALSAAREAIESRGAVVAITPDGPRGPRMRAQPGIAQLSVATGRAVVPAAFATRRARVLRSWDRFLLPLPFDRGVQLFGTPIPPPAEASPEAVERHRAAIEVATTALTRRADRLCGRDPVEPDPVT